MAVQWLPPSQTAGGKHPYMFTQCQAIHARALLPCQDSPGVKAPYTASLTVPDGLVGLMSAISTDFPAAAGDGAARTFCFEQTVPMATYLIAIAAGNLEKRDVGPRTAVWSEPEMVEEGAFEFADTERFVGARERKRRHSFVFGCAPQNAIPMICQDRLGTSTNPCRYFRIAALGEEIMTPYEWGRYGAKNDIFFGVFPMFVPSLSWQNDRFYI